MPYEYLEGIVTADEAFRAWGSSLEETFTSAVDALLGIMMKNPETLGMEQRKDIEIEEESLEFLLYSFLKEILFMKDAYRLLLRPNSIHIKQANNKWKLKAELVGEPIDNRIEELLVDVKAITLHRFKLEKTDGLWEAMVVVDV